jgi:hypothetical protein
MRLLKISSYLLIILFIAKCHKKDIDSLEASSFSQKTYNLYERHFNNKIPDTPYIFSNEKILQPVFHIISSEIIEQSYFPLKTDSENLIPIIPNLLFYQADTDRRMFQ